MKKVLIFYGSFGGGHFSAGKAIESKLKNMDNVEAQLIDSIEYVSKRINKIYTGFYSQVVKGFPWFWKRLYLKSEKGTLSKVLYSSNSLTSNKLNKIITDFKPDAIVCTHPYSAQACTHLKKHGKINAKISIIITDYEIHSLWYSKHEFLDNIFVGSNKMKNDLILKNIDPNKVHVTGLPIKKEFNKIYNKKEILNSLKLDTEKETFLFFGGGELGLGKDMPAYTLDKALKIFDDKQFIVISGKNDKLYNKFKNIIKEHQAEERAILIKYTDKIPEYMHVSTAVFSKPGGLTTTEAIFSNLPFIIFGPLPGQEIANTKFILENNIGVFISTKETIESVLDNLKRNPNSLDIMRENIQKIKKPNATLDICNTILENI